MVAPSVPFRSAPALAALGLLVLSLVGCTNYGPAPWTGTGAPARPAAPTYAPVVEAGQHLVLPGDTLSHIALRYGVATRDLARFNGLSDPNRIYAGQVLGIPGRRQTAPMPVEITTEDRRHVVAEGENLGLIAQRYGVRVGDLLAFNDLPDPNRLRVGQPLVIPDPERESRSQLAAQVVESPERAEAKRRAAATPPPPLSGKGFLWPASGQVIVSFGPKAEGRRNDGINIGARLGAPVRAAENGIVVYAGDELRAYGLMILIRHDQNYLTTYAHNGALLVDIGDRVERGQVIARVGASGRVAEPQLHFALRKGREPLDPMAHLVDLPTAVAASD